MSAWFEGKRRMFGPLCGDHSDPVLLKVDDGSEGREEGV